MPAYLESGLPTLSQVEDENGTRNSASPGGFRCGQEVDLVDLLHEERVGWWVVW